MLVEISLSFNIEADGNLVEIRKTAEGVIRKALYDQIDMLLKDSDSRLILHGLNVAYCGAKLVPMVEEAGGEARATGDLGWLTGRTP